MNVFDTIRIIRLIVFFVSCIGYYELIADKMRLNKYLLPSFVISAQMIILTIAAILNCLIEVTILVFVAGIILFLLYTKKFPGGGGT